MKIEDFISEKIATLKHHPFLFIGSGFSKRYLGLENWEELLRKFSNMISGETLKYDSYANRVEEKDYYGKQPKIASLLENDFNEAVFTEESFKSFREKNEGLLMKGVSPFKIAIANYFENIDMEKIEETAEIKLLKEIAVRNISGIITTNYDHLIEKLFNEYATYIGQDELIFSELSGMGEIYKIHGSAERPESIVITSADYEEFERKSAYLIAKILTIFLEHPIIFLGYSINDTNIQNILKSISKCLNTKKLIELRERLIFVDYSTEREEITAYSKEFEGGATIEMTKITTENYLPIFQGIKKINAKFNPKLIRKLKKEICSLVETEPINGSIVATGFENINNLDDMNQFVISVGASIKHGHMIKAEKIYEDIVLDNQYFNSRLVLEEYLETLLKSNSGGLPMYKYIKDYPELVFGRVKEETLKKVNIESFLNSQQLKSKENYRKTLVNKNVEEIIKREGIHEAYKRLYFLERDEIDLEELKNYLVNILKNDLVKLEANTELKRLIRIYDLLKYKKNTSA